MARALPADKIIASRWLTGGDARVLSRGGKVEGFDRGTLVLSDVGPVARVAGREAFKAFTDDRSGGWPVPKELGAAWSFPAHMAQGLPNRQGAARGTTATGSSPDGRVVPSVAGAASRLAHDPRLCSPGTKRAYRCRRTGTTIFDNANAPLMAGQSSSEGFCPVLWLPEFLGIRRRRKKRRASPD